MSGDMRTWAAALALLAVPAGALGAQSFRSDREFADWGTFYYEHPQPARSGCSGGPPARAWSSTRCSTGA
jgi:hypothetical protein